MVDGGLILLNPFVVENVLPLVLVFTLVFAILEKTRVLGEDKRQINAILGFIIGLILIASPVKYIVIELMPFLAVSLVILFVFMLIYGFVVGKTDGDVLNKGLKITLGIIFGLALVTFLLYITGYWEFIHSYTFGGGSNIWYNALLGIVIIGVIIAVIQGDKGVSSS